MGLCSRAGQNGEHDDTQDLYTDSLQLIREMRVVVAAIGRRDPDLGRQMRRALASIPLNIAEGEGQKNGNATLRFF